MSKQEKLFPWQPEIPEGHVRIYEDHTGRWYEDITEEEARRRDEEANNDPLMTILREEIQKEVNAEILAKIGFSTTTSVGDPPREVRRRPLSERYTLVSPDKKPE